MVKYFGILNQLKNGAIDLFMMYSSMFHSFIRSFEYVFLSATLISGSVKIEKGEHFCSQDFNSVTYTFLLCIGQRNKNTKTTLGRKQVPET